MEPLIRCYDNEGDTADRYSVYVWDGESKHEGRPMVFAYTMNSTPTSPQGIGQTTWVNDHRPTIDFPQADRLIPYTALPDACRELIEGDNPGPNFESVDVLSGHDIEGGDIQGANASIWTNGVTDASDYLDDKWIQDEVSDAWFENGWVEESNGRIDLTETGREQINEDSGVVIENVVSWLQSTFEDARLDVPPERCGREDAGEAIVAFDANDIRQLEELQGEGVGDGVIRRFPEHFSMDAEDTVFEGVSNLGTQLLYFGVEFSGKALQQRHQALYDLKHELSEQTFEDGDLERTSWDDIPGEDQRALLDFLGYEPDEFPTDNQFNQLYELWADQQSVRSGMEL